MTKRKPTPARERLLTEPVPLAIHATPAPGWVTVKGPYGEYQTPAPVAEVSAAGHTPGPWLVGESSRQFITAGHRSHVEWNGGVGTNKVEYRYVAEVCYSAHVDANERAANARLIAAAPDLVAALERAEELAREVAFKHGLTYSDAEGIAEQSRAALQKAGGIE